jgi:DNA-directed RNA polymerase specialized sigma24 family protein
MAINAAKADFHAIYRTYCSDEHRFVFLFVQDGSLADGLTQHAFLIAYPGWRRFRGEAPERIWLLRIACIVPLHYPRSPPPAFARRYP